MENQKMNALLAATRLAEAMTTIIKAQADMINTVDNVLTQIQNLIISTPAEPQITTVTNRDRSNTNRDGSIYVEVDARDVKKVTKPVSKRLTGNHIPAADIKSFMAGPPRQTGYSLAVDLSMPNPKTSGVAQVTAFRRMGISSRSKYYKRCKKLMRISLEKNAQVRDSLKLRPVEELFKQRLDEARTQGERQRLSRGLSVLRGDKNHARITNVWAFSQLDLKSGEIPRRKGVGRMTVNTLQDLQNDLRLDMEAKFV